MASGDRDDTSTTTPTPEERDEAVRTLFPGFDLDRARRRKRIALIGLAVFAAFGFFWFGPRMPREMQVRFDLPPTLRGGGYELAREDAKSLSARVYDAEGQQVGAIELSLARQSGPRTSVSVMNLRPGQYSFAVDIGGAGRRVPMHGLIELDSGEAIVSLKAGTRGSADPFD